MQIKGCAIGKRSMQDWSTFISNVVKGKGFYTPTSLDTEEEREKVLGKLMLVVTEIAEAAEAVRHNDWDNFKEEMADAMIRMFDMCGAMNLDIEEEIENKMIINVKRP